MQKKELSFSHSFPAISLCFEVSPSSQISSGKEFPGYFLERPNAAARNPALTAFLLFLAEAASAGED